jgi:hypothetical protein
MKGGEGRILRWAFPGQGSYIYTMVCQTMKSATKFRMSFRGVLAMLFVLHLAQGCSTGIKNVVQTGVNEAIVPVSSLLTERDLEARRRPDPMPYSALTLQGSLNKSDVVRAVNQNRKALDRCYRDVFAVESRLRERESLRHLERKVYMRPYDTNGKVQADGLRHSTNFNTPFAAETATVEGDVFMHFRVDIEGKAHEVRISLSDLKDTRFHACLEKVVAGFQFGTQETETTVRSLILRFDQESGFVKRGG